MKRIALFSFIFIAATLINLPQSIQQAAQLDEYSESLTRTRKLAMKRKMMNPHEGISSQIDRVGEISRATIDVARALPEVRNARQITKSSAGARAEVSDNIIDKEIFGTLAAKGVEPAQPATDEEFCRRIFLDLTGRQPDPERQLKYVADTDPNKKEKLIAELIGSESYINRWTVWMGDLVRTFLLSSRNERNAEYLFLRDAIAKNKPFNQVATEMITFNGRCDKGPGSFLVRPIFAVDIVQDGYDELAAETVRTFLGTQAVCVSCHNGEGHLEQVNLYLSGKKRAEFWGLSAFFAKTNFIYPSRKNPSFGIQNKTEGAYNALTKDGMRPPREGGIIPPSYGLFGDGKPNDREELRSALARLIISDPQFARAFVNRVFAHFFTLGLVEPLDGFDLARLDPNNPPPAPWELQPSHPVLLNDLASYFRQNNYDMRTLITLIVRSKAYSLSSRYDETKWKQEYTQLYARKLTRRLEAEEVLDAITNSTLVPATYMVFGFSKPLSSTMALPGVEEPSNATNGMRPSDDPTTVFRFLEAFGRGDRFTSPRSNNSSITQAFSLFNSELLIRRIESDEGLPNQLTKALQQKNATPEQAVAYLYLMTIGRAPTPAEVDRFKDHITGGKLAVADLQWALFNRVDFLYNY
jgi:hypothetical protein